MSGGRWPVPVEEILGGDLVVAMGLRTSAGGVVVIPITPLGEHDPRARTVGVTTSLAFWRKLERLDHDDRCALFYHAREHGYARSPHLVLVQGRAGLVPEPGPFWTEEVARAWSRFLVPRKRGRFWDWVGREYYDHRVHIVMDVHRLVVTLPGAGGEDESFADLPTAAAPDTQSPPAGGPRPRLRPRSYRRRLSRSRHFVLGYVGGDGFPVLRRVEVDPEGDHLVVVGAGLPAGARRAGLLGHWFESRLKGQGQAAMTEWLEVDDGRGTYAPHTYTCYALPRLNDAAFSVAVGLASKARSRKAVRLGWVRDGRYQRADPG